MWGDGAGGLEVEGEAVEGREVLLMQRPGGESSSWGDMLAILSSLLPILLMLPSIMLTERSTLNGMWLSEDRGSWPSLLHCWLEAMLSPQQAESVNSELLLLLNLEFGRVTGQREWRRWKPRTLRLCCCCELVGEPSVASRPRKFCHTKGERRRIDVSFLHSWSSGAWLAGSSWAERRF